MWIESLKLTNFRNFSSLEAKCGQGVNIFYGNNGSGKTNLLEAIFALCLGRSQRGANDLTMVREGAEIFRIEGRVNLNGQACELALAYQRKSRKKITLDKEVIRLAQLYDRFAVVSAGPEDSNILSGSPSTRRTFIDIYLSQLSREYLSNLSEYQKVLNQKNAALKKEMDPGPFEPLQIQIGSKIMLKRYEFVISLSEKFERYYHSIADGEEATVEYHPSVKSESGHSALAEIVADFEAKLTRYAERERIMHNAMVGPHRDDLYFEINALPARAFGSQGQWRTAAIATKLAIHDMLKEKRDQPPILLLDEIFAELDPDRCEHLIEAFAGFSQLFLTTATEPPENLKAGSRSFRIFDGAIAEIN